MNLGIIKATKGEHVEAFNCYERALSYRKNYAVCYYNLGNLVSYQPKSDLKGNSFSNCFILQYLEMKNYPMAFDSWKKSLAINPKQSRPWSNILTLLDSEGKK